MAGAARAEQNCSLARLCDPRRRKSAVIHDLEAPGCGQSRSWQLENFGGTFSRRWGSGGRCFYGSDSFDAYGLRPLRRREPRVVGLLLVSRQRSTMATPPLLVPDVQARPRRSAVTLAGRP